MKTTKKNTKRPVCAVCGSDVDLVKIRKGIDKGFIVCRDVKVCQMNSANNFKRMWGMK